MNIGGSIPKSCGGWHDTKGAYRYLSNEKVTWDKILAPHWESTEQRVKAHKVVLCIQDTTELDFTGKEIKDLGRLNYDDRRGMYVHPTLLITPERLSLGVSDLWMWSRGASKAEDINTPSVVESQRWLEGYERIAEMASRCPETRLVYLADREADIWGLISKATTLGHPADWLVRARHNRTVMSDSKPQEAESLKLWDGFTEIHELGRIKFVLPARNRQPSREVEQTLSVRRCRVQQGTETLEVTAILANEEKPAEGVEAVQWRLLTNRMATTLEQVAELLDWYRARWEIEMFFNVLKNGCQIEKLQLTEKSKLERALALYVLVAWRVMFLMRLGRVCPDIDCDIFFTEEEWQSAYICHRKPIPEQVPTLNTVLHLVAQFGGFLNRKGDGEPGTKTLWIGLQRLYDFTSAIQAFKSQQTYG